MLVVSTERVKRAAANEEKHEPNWTRYDVKVIRTCGMPIHEILVKKYFHGCFSFYME